MRRPATTSADDFIGWDLSVSESRIEHMGRIRLAAVLAGVVFVAWSGAAGGAPAALRADSVLIPTRAGSSLSRVVVPEPAGVIRLFRVVAPAGARLRVTGVIAGLAGVSISLPPARLANAESCTGRSGSVVCLQGEEACPMPPANWHFRVRKVSGPAGRIRIDFIVGPEHSR